MTEKKISPFDYVNAINNGGNMDTMENYSQYLINRQFSYFLDTVLFANEMNMYQDLTDDQHFLFLRSLITKKRRFTKWGKPKNSNDAQALARNFNISMYRAYEILPIFTREQLDNIKESLYMEDDESTTKSKKAT